MLTSFCSQWCLGSRMPPEPKQKWFRWIAALWVTWGSGRGCAILLRLESVTWSTALPLWHELLLPPSPPTAPPQNKQMRKVPSSIQARQSIVPPLGREGIVLRYCLQCKGRIKKQNKKGRMAPSGYQPNWKKEDIVGMRFSKTLLVSIFVTCNIPIKLLAIILIILVWQLDFMQISCSFC